MTEEQKRKYHMVGDAVDGNLARKLRTEELQRQLEESGRPEFEERRAVREERRPQERTRPAVRPLYRVSPLAVLGTAVLALMVVAVLGCYVELNHISGNIVELKNEITACEVEQIALLTQYERVFDLNSVAETASEMGMAQPGDSQIFYVTLPGEDCAVWCSEADEGFLRGIWEKVTTRIDCLWAER